MRSVNVAGVRLTHVSAKQDLGASVPPGVVDYEEDHDQYAGSLPGPLESPPPEPPHSQLGKTAMFAALAAVSVAGLAGCDSPEPPPPVVDSLDVTDHQALESLQFFDTHPMKGFEEGGLYKKFLFSHRRISPERALERLQAGDPVYLPLGEDQYLSVDSLADLAKLDSFRGSGRNNVLPENQFQAIRALESQFSNPEDGQPLDAYQAFSRLDERKAVTVAAGGHSLRVDDFGDLVEIHGLYGRGDLTGIMTDAQKETMLHYDARFADGSAFEALENMQRGRGATLENRLLLSPTDAIEFDALQGRRENTILPQEQYDALTQLGPGFDGGAYGALQDLQAGREAIFWMPGGVYNEVLRDGVKAPDELGALLERVQNQQEADRYRLPTEAFDERAEQVGAQAVRAGENALDDARDDLRHAERDMSRARSMPTTVSEQYTTTEWTYHYGYNFSSGEYEYHYGPETVTKTRQVNNDDRDRAISRARREISEAEGDIQNAERVLQRLRALEERLASASDAQAFDDTVTALREEIASLRGGNRDAGVSAQLARADGLLRTMQRPHRPAGWTPPTPRVDGGT